MNKKFDVGIVGCWYWGNYGSILNGYATHHLLKSMGLSALNIVTPYNGFEPHAKKFFEIAYEKDEISPVLPFEQLYEFNQNCEGFLTGSDQIWNYKPGKADRKYDKYFRLDFAADEKRKVSFATSFGKYVPESKEDHKIFEELLKRYHAISVREQEGVDILRNSYGLEATQVMEPVLDVNIDCWYNLAEHSKYHESEQYLLTYILDPTPEKRKAINYYSEKLGMKAVHILDGFSGIYQKNKEKLDLPNTLPNIWCADFLKYFSNSYYIITDSFHGVCFSLIFNKPFIAIGNHTRGMKRFETLLDKVGLQNRLVSDTNIPLNEKLLYHLDYTKANQIIESERRRSLKWLEQSFKTSDLNKVNHIKRHVNTLLPENDCMGCGACVASCPVNAIKLVEDNYGIYRARVDSSKCIDCGKCKKVCAALELPKKLNSSNPYTYAFISSDDNIAMASSSGGAFTTLAKTILSQNGIVIGAAWQEDFSVKHILIDNIEELPKLQKSKYFQSYMGDIIKELKKHADSGRKVLFCGTPCQVAGVKKMLHKDYHNVILIDLLCANCPSAWFFKKYFNENFSTKDIKQYNFRYKSCNDKVWDAKKIEIIYKNNEREVKTIENDEYLQVYHTCSLALSSQCLKCKYQGSTRFGDLTIGDCWGIENYDKSVNASKGVSVILVNNNKGMNLLEEITPNNISVLKEEPLEQIKKYNSLAFIENRNWPITQRRQQFFDKILNESFHNTKNAAIVLPNSPYSDKDIGHRNLEPVKGMRISNNNKNSLLLEWDKCVNASGYILEQFKDEKWSRIARIGNNSTISHIVNDLLPSTSYRFRIKAFDFAEDKSTPIYSIYKEITGTTI